MAWLGVLNALQYLEQAIENLERQCQADVCADKPGEGIDLAVTAAMTPLGRIPCLRPASQTRRQIFAAVRRYRQQEKLRNGGE